MKEKCAHCRRESIATCDFMIGLARCDSAICKVCATAKGNLKFCPNHRPGTLTALDNAPEETDTPRWISSQFQTRCRRCTGYINKGNQALYFPTAKKALCQPCGQDYEKGNQ